MIQLRMLFLCVALVIYGEKFEKMVIFPPTTIAARSGAWNLIAWTVGSWVRIPFKAWILATFCVAQSCVGASLWTGRSAVKEVLPLA